MALYHIFEDGHRRVAIAKSQGRTDRSKMWTGLGFPSEMKEAIAKGYMRPVFSETPRVLNWYTFTDAGWAEYDRLYADAPDFFDPNFSSYRIPRKVA